MTKLRQHIAVIPLLIMAVGTLLFASCFPGWMPDSKSFLYVLADGRVMAFDVETGKSRQVAKTEPVVEGEIGFGQLHYVAVAPDGKRFVVSRLVAEKNQIKQLVLDIFSINGKRIESSKPVDFDRESYFFNLNWTSDSKFIAITAFGGECSLCYDVEKKSFQRIEAVGLAVGNGLIPAYSSISPDDSLFFGRTDGESDFEICLFKLPSGKKVHTFDLSNLPKRVRKYFESTTTEDLHLVLPAFWEERQLVFPINDGEVRFDLQKKTVAFQQVERLKKLSDEAERNEVTVIAASGDSKTSWQLVQKDVKSQKHLTRIRYSIRFPKTGKVEKLSESDINFYWAKVSPSPNGKYTGVWASNDAIVIDEVGKTTRLEVLPEQD